LVLFARRFNLYSPYNKKVRAEAAEMMRKCHHVLVNNMQDDYIGG
jgi:hypothetical protein